MEIDKHLHDRVVRVNNKLEEHILEQARELPELQDAMLYSVSSGGKCIRPLLVYLTGESLGAQLKSLDSLACAVELVHSYSLIHDDLPSMDNASLRRGKPTCHMAFSEATAILVGDALLPLAFELLANDERHDAGVRVKMLSTLSKAAGVSGMVGGQVLDLSPKKLTSDISDLDLLYAKKTGALIHASVILGALGTNCLQDDVLLELGDFASFIGLAYQIQDDILDIEASTKILGKKQGSDARLNKHTYPSIIGVESSKKKVIELFDQAVEKLDVLGKNRGPLEVLAKCIVKREY